MTEIDIAYIVVLLASINLSYMVGKKIGIESTINYLEEEGILEFDEEV
jgi:hypothetical protein